jgi:2-dehydropantoate 2-reductase
MQIAIVGAGAIGTYLGVRLHEAGHEVTLVARPEQVVRLSHTGLCARIGKRERSARVSVVDQLADAPDLLLLTVKMPDLAAACQSVAPAVRGVPTVTLQNGVRADAVAGSILGPAMIVGGIAMCAATCLQPGEVTVHLPGWLMLGTPPGHARTHLARAADALGAAISIRICHDLVGARWSKLLGNLNNGVSAATGLSWSQLARSSRGRRLSLRLVREGHRVARGAGVKLDYLVYVLGLPLAVRIALGRGEFRGSTWQSVVRGRRSEIEDLNGEVVRVGRQLGIATPYNARVVEAVHAAERTGRWCSLDELWPSAA